jgi:two-component system OmpR family response regulator
MSEVIRSHVLVVDDDPQIRTLLNEYLAENGLRVSVAASGQELRQVLAEETIDLVILDLRLEGEDGMSIARSMRERFSTPVIMLTGVRDEADRVMGLELGADDYITKPFSPRELLARIRTVLRRTKAAAAESGQRREIRAYRFGDFELNLLAALLAAPERILSRDQLLEASRVFDNEVYDRAIDIQVLRLRRKIEVDASQPRYIVTERGVGYIFKVPVEVLY